VKMTAVTSLKLMSRLWSTTYTCPSKVQSTYFIDQYLLSVKTSSLWKIIFRKQFAP